MFKKSYQKYEIRDEVLGTLELNRDLGMLDGEILWDGAKAFLALEIDMEDEKTWDTARSIARKVMADCKSWDKSLREFAAKELTELANEWQADDNEKENADPITEEAFARRITLTELCLSYRGDFTVYFDDDDMFWEHAIEVCGSLENGIETVDIVG